MSGTLEEFDRDAVITIQGGGIYGLFLIGQLEFVLQDLRIKPLAYAGTSAGAILATLSWAGYSPRQIRELFVNQANAEGGIVSLLGPYSASEASDAFKFSDLGPLAKRLQSLAATLPKLIKSVEPLGKLGSKSLCAKIRTLWKLRNQIDFNGLTTAFRDGETVLGLTSALGCFPGDALEDQVDMWLRKSPLFRDFTLPQGQTRLTFRHARQLAAGPVAPPLFLAATNLSTRSLELFSSVSDASDEYDYDDVPIAAAVRASVAVPGFFRPVRIRVNNREASFVDGGWISNYPMWVFSRELRAKLLRIPVYQVVGSKPWVHVGLRLFRKASPDGKDISTVSDFAGAAFELVTGGARSEMDDRACPQDARSRPVWQKANDASVVKDFLDLKAFDANLVKSCFTDGREAAQRWLGEMSFALPEAEDIEAMLRELVTFATKLFKAASPGLDIKPRSNVFLPIGHRFCVTYRANMDDHLDTDRDLSFADTKSGLSGFVFTRRRTMICNLGEIGALYSSGNIEAKDLFGMDKKLGGIVREDRTWLASVPIFDPLGIVPERWTDGKLDYEGEYYHELPPSIDGPVFGVLNLDASIPFREDETELDKLHPDVRKPEHWTDVRVVSIIAKMEQTALHLGQRFSRSFGQNSTSPAADS